MQDNQSESLDELNSTEPSTQERESLKTRRIVMGLEYNGAAFDGWQTQKHHNGRFIQQELERAISKVADQPISIVCAGRTDSGVHASAQVIHFDTTAVRKDFGWLRGVNTHSPDEISIQWVQEISDEFHARFSAVARVYRYAILNRPTPSAQLVKQLTWVRESLDEKAMHQAAQALLGEQDFTSYRAKDCQANHPNRNMKSISVQRFGDYVVVQLEANAFLYHMVRNIMGVLIPIGLGEQPVEWAGEVLAAKDRTKAGVTAHSDGLYFCGVRYPDFDLPAPPIGPHFLSAMMDQ